MGTVKKHLLPDWVKPSFVISDIWTLCQSARISEITNDSLAQSVSEHRILNAPCLNPSQVGWYSICLPRGMEGWVDLAEFCM